MSEIRSELVLQFRSWIFTNTRPEYTIRDISQELIEISTEEATAYIRFYEMNIVEFSIQDKKKQETVFYLHFQVNDLNHAEQLFHEMTDSLLSITNDRTVNILLCCTSGLTTGYFAEKLNESAKVLSLNYHFDAVSYDRVFTEGIHYDAVILAPQAGYLEKKVRESLQPVPVKTIPAQIYGKYDTGALIRMVGEMIAQKKPPETASEKVSRAFDNDRKILSICVLNGARHVEIGYRYYKNGNIEEESQVIKPRITWQDLFDITDTMLALHPEIECIGLTMPGTAYKGRLYLPAMGFNYDNIAQEMRRRYGCLCILSNDANAAAEGIYALQSHYQNLVYHFQPYGFARAGEGIIIDGKLYNGKHHRAGEVTGLVELLKYDAPTEQLGKTPESTVELVARQIAAVHSVIDPEAVFLCVPMAPEKEEMEKEIRKYIPEEYMPDLYMVRDPHEYMMVGTMLKCLEWLEKKEA